MRILLDTCTFLWLAGGSSLSPTAAAAIRNPSHEVYLSSVSAWEIITKHSSGRLPLPEPPDRLIQTEHGLAIVTPDQSIAQYPVRTIW